MSGSKDIIFFIIILIGAFVFYKWYSKFKFPKITCIAVFTGAVKVGKTGVSLACAKQKYRFVHFRWRVICFFLKLFGKKNLPEEPLFYSNVELSGIKYHPLELDHILRKKRFNFKSVVFVDEASLLADCYLSKDRPELSTELLKFFKLFGHMTHNGYCILNSQQISDLHISLRKVTSQYYYVHETSSRFIPFVAFCRMREERYTEDKSAINVYDKDVEDTLKTCIFSKRVFKQYDPYCYSILTDNLDNSSVEHFNKIGSNLKAKKLISFRKEFVDLFNEGLKVGENLCEKEKD